MSVQNWGEEIQEEVYDYWRENHPNHEEGFKIFYSPIRENPDLLVAGINPAGKPEHFKPDLERFERGDFSLPEDHEYLEADYPYASDIRRVFDGHLDLLDGSVALNVFPFRTGEDVWNNPSGEQAEMKEFGLSVFNRVVDRVCPKLVLICGINAFRDVIGTRELKSDGLIYRPNQPNAPILLTARSRNVRYCGLYHPSRLGDTAAKAAILFVQEFLNK